MSKSKHTPGPWTIIEQYRTSIEYEPMPGVKYTLADLTSDVLPVGTVRANAHLIAAAPKLLEVAEYAEKELVAVYKAAEKELVARELIVGLLRRLEEIRTIIAKAKGDKP